MDRFLQATLFSWIMSATALSQSVAWTVQEQWGAGTTQATKIVPVGSGHLMISGGYGASANNGCGGMYISKYDTQGNRIWSDSLNYSKFWAGPAIAPNGSSYHFLYKYPDFFIRKYSSAGLKLLDVPLSNRSIEGSDLTYGHDGYLYLTGNIQDSAQIGQTIYKSGGYITKLDTTGQVVWTRSVKLINNTYFTDFSNAMRVKYFNGNIFVLGALKGSASIGSTYLNGYSSYFLKMDSAGTVINAFMLPTICEDMQIDNDGNLYFKGEFGGSATFGQITITQTTSDYFSYCVAKFNGNSWVWAKELPGIGRGALTVNEKKEVFCLGNSTINNWNKVYNISRLDSSGNFTWSYTSNPSPTPQYYSATNISANDYDIFVIGQSVHAFLTKFSNTVNAINENTGNCGVIRIYPNPTSNAIDIFCTPSKNSTIYITDIQGKTLLGPKHPYNGKLSIDLSSLPPGEYQVNIIDKGSRQCKILLKQ